MTAHVDLHCHVLPGIDDGPADIEESMALIAASTGDGTVVIAATPHLRPDHPGVKLEELADRCRELEAEARTTYDVWIVPAAEVDLLTATNCSKEQLRLASYRQAGTDLLIETPSAPLPDRFEDALFSITAQGFRILLAHPERNPSFQAAPARLAALAERGVLVQVTAPSILMDGRKARSRRLALELIRSGIACSIGSDAHSAGPFRPPQLSKAADQVKRVGGAHAEWLVGTAPAAILSGARLPPVPRRGLRRRRR
jgi:protein-tyrosine phosphatase